MKSRFAAGSLLSFCILPQHLSAEGISSVDIFKNFVYTQNSGAAPTTPSGYFADVELTSIGSNDFNTVTATFPGASTPTGIPQVSPTFFSYGPAFTTLADTNAAVPFGAYEYLAVDSFTGDSESTTLNYTADAFGSAIPALSSATFNSLMGLNPDQSLEIDFNSFTPAVNASLGFTFFTITDGSGHVVFTDGFLDPSTTSFVLPANTLMANTTYNFELDFSDRQNGTTSPTGGDLGVGSTIGTFIGSDLRDDGSFTTGAAVLSPEPGTILLLFTGVAGLTALRGRRAKP